MRNRLPQRRLDSKPKRLPKPKPVATCFQETTNGDWDRLDKIYKVCPIKARAIFIIEALRPERRRIVLFEHANGDFQICQMGVTMGISITNKRYTNETRLRGITYKAKTKFIYCVGFNSITDLNHGNLDLFLHEINDEARTLTMNHLMKYMGWMRFIMETDRFRSMSFNMIIRNKLFSTEKLLKYVYKGVNKPVAKKVQGVFSIPQWKAMLPYLSNVENIRMDLTSDHLFQDTLKMAKALNRKINVNWSEKRLKAVHDEWATEVHKILMEFIEHKTLKVSDIFKEFADFTGYKILDTSQDIVAEGKMMSHCVGGYVSHVESQTSGLYHIEHGTLELKHDYVYIGKTCATLVKISQFKSFGNKAVSNELSAQVSESVVLFNEEKRKQAFEKENLRLIAESKPPEFKYEPLVAYRDTTSYADVNEEIPF